MKIYKKNNLKNIKLVKSYKLYYLKKIIFNSLLKNSNSIKIKYLIKLKYNNITKHRQISRQINMCKISGTYKKSFNLIGINRHQLRNLLNVNKIIHLKKNSW